MNPIVRNILAVIAGLVVAFVIIGVLEAAGHVIYPLPEHVDPMDYESLRAHMSEIPAGALIIVLVAHFLGTMGGGVLTGWIAKRKEIMLGMIVGGVVLLAGIVNLIFIPHPIWFLFGEIIAFLGGALLGSLVAVKINGKRQIAA